MVYGGDFPTVNTTAQQGLVRFAVPSIAPNIVKPTSNAGLTPTATSTTPGRATINWTSTSDRDNAVLTYKVYRNYVKITDPPVCAVTDTSLFWKPKALSCVDTTAPPGTTVNYRVIVFDPFGNRNTGTTVAVTVAPEPTPAARAAQAAPAATGTSDRHSDRHTDRHTCRRREGPGQVGHSRPCAARRTNTSVAARVTTLPSPRS